MLLAHMSGFAAINAGAKLQALEVGTNPLGNDAVLGGLKNGLGLGFFEALRKHCDRSSLHLHGWLSCRSGV